MEPKSSNQTYNKLYLVSFFVNRALKNGAFFNTKEFYFAVSVGLISRVHIQSFMLRILIHSTVCLRFNETPSTKLLNALLLCYELKYSSYDFLLLRRSKLSDTRTNFTKFSIHYKVCIN